MIYNIDYNLDNYTYDELLSIFDISDYNEIIITEKLNSKIFQIKQNINNIEEYKEIIDFFYNAFLKIKLQNVKINSYDDKINNYANKINNQIENPIETFNLDFKKGLINPLKIQTIKKIIAINSMFRGKIFKESSEFDCILSEPIKNVTSIKLLNYTLPLSIYSVSSKLGTNNFNIKYQSKELKIILENGSYSVSDLIDKINYKLGENDLSNISINYNTITGKIYFKNINNDNFKLEFTYNESLENNCKYMNKELKNYSTLGWFLGYRNIENNLVYNNNSYYESESIYDVYSNHDFLLYLNDYTNNTMSTFTLPKYNSYQLLNNKNILAKINSNNSIIKYPKRKYFGPVDINKLSIKIIDNLGRLIDFNNADISIDIECETVYEY